MQGSEAVYLLNGEQCTLHGFTPTTRYLGMSKDNLGKPIHNFAPTRRQRRAFLQKKRSNYQKYGPFLKRLQVECDKDGNRKVIPHFD